MGGQQFAAFLPNQRRRHPLVGHRPRIPDRVFSTSSSKSSSTAVPTRGSLMSAVSLPPFAAAGMNGSTMAPWHGSPPRVRLSQLGALIFETGEPLRQVLPADAADAQLINRQADDG